MRSSELAGRLCSSGSVHGRLICWRRTRGCCSSCSGSRSSIWRTAGLWGWWWRHLPAAAVPPQPPGPHLTDCVLHSAQGTAVSLRSILAQYPFTALAFLSATACVQLLPLNKMLLIFNLCHCCRILLYYNVVLHTGAARNGLP